MVLYDSMSRVTRNPFFAYAKTKTQISFAVTTRLISAFVFDTRKVQSLYFLNPKFHASRHLLWFYSPDYVGPGRKPRRQVFSQRGSYINRHHFCRRFTSRRFMFFVVLLKPCIYFAMAIERGLIFKIQRLSLKIQLF